MFYWYFKTPLIHLQHCWWTTALYIVPCYEYLQGLRHICVYWLYSAEPFPQSPFSCVAWNSLLKAFTKPINSIKYSFKLKGKKIMRTTSKTEIFLCSHHFPTDQVYCTSAFILSQKIFISRDYEGRWVFSWLRVKLRNWSGSWGISFSWVIQDTSWESQGQQEYISTAINRFPAYPSRTVPDLWSAEVIRTCVQENPSSQEPRRMSLRKGSLGWL